MQYVRSISGSVSKTWNSINPATLSGAIDVIVVELDDGTLACSPFHVRFGKFSLLRPSEKKVEFRVNNVRQDYAMKLGEGGEAFFVFETTANVPEGLQTSPLVSPITSPSTGPASESGSISGLTTDPEPLELDADGTSSDDIAAKRADSVKVPERPLARDVSIPVLSKSYTDLPPHYKASDAPLNPSDLLMRNNVSLGIEHPGSRPRGSSQPPTLETSQQVKHHSQDSNASDDGQKSERGSSPLLVPRHQAISRAMTLSKKLSISNIPSHVNDDGDLMLDMTGFKSSEEEALRAEVLARQILAEELEGNYDIGSLIGADEKGNLWIYSSEEAKAAAAKKAAFQTYSQEAMSSTGALSDPGYHSDDAQSSKSVDLTNRRDRADSDASISSTPPASPTFSSPVEPTRSYAKTLRLTSEQLKAMNLKHGANPISFSVNRATCTANIYLWTHQTPIVISDIDGTITKSDALGHVLNMIGKDWTHLGVAKLYSDIVANGYNILYLTSRSVGQADTTRTYISGINQDGYKLPRGPVIMSPDRTIAALRREIYLRKPEVFKMACLRDIMSLFPGRQTPFYAGFGNRLTDALSYRAVNIPSTRIFTINSNAEVSLDLLSLNKYKTAYTSMRETVDQFFPPVGTLVQDGGDDYTDFNYWRDTPVEIDDLSATESDIDEDDYPRRSFRSLRSEDEGSDVMSDELAESYMSRNSLEDSMTLHRTQPTDFSDDDEHDGDFRG